MPPEQCSSPISYSEAFLQECVPSLGHSFSKSASLRVSVLLLALLTSFAAIPQKSFLYPLIPNISRLDT